MFDVAGRLTPSPQWRGLPREQTGAVRSWAWQHFLRRRAAAGGDGRQLSAMRLPDLQRLAQSLGLAGTARMRKGQLIAAIEAAGQPRPRTASGSASHAGTGPEPNQSESSGNSAKRTAPAGAGANRPFEQDAMESERSGQLSMVSADPVGPGGAGPPPALRSRGGAARTRRRSPRPGLAGGPRRRATAPVSGDAASGATSGAQRRAPRSAPRAAAPFARRLARMARPPTRLARTATPAPPGAAAAPGAMASATAAAATAAGMTRAGLASRRGSDDQA